MSFYDHIKGILQARNQAETDQFWGKSIKPLKELHQEATASAVGSGKLSKKAKDTKADAEERLFEFAVFLEVACALVDAIGNKNGEWTLCASEKDAGKGQKRAVWPMAAGSPENFSYLKGQLGGEVVHIRPGVKAVTDSCGTVIAPDVSLRLARGGESDRCKEPIIRMWDAKHRKKAEGRISRQEVFTFAMEVRLLTAPQRSQLFAPPRNLRCNKSLLLSSCALITNGKHSHEELAFLRNHSVLEIHDFSSGSRPQDWSCRGV